MKLIGLVGPAGAGKGTVSKSLWNNGYECVAFADPLKDVVAVIFGWSRSLLEGETKESREFREKEDPWWSEKFGYPVTPRKMLQLMGTEAGRDVFHPDIWIHSLERRIRGVAKVVVTDVRFPNEIDFIRKNGGKIVRVSREDPPHIKALDENGLSEASGLRLMEFITVKYPTVHYSEYAWYNQPVDYRIQNDGTLDELKDKVDTLLTTIKMSDTIFHHQV